MAEGLEKYGLDAHCTMILEEYCERIPEFEKLRESVLRIIREAIAANHLPVMTVDSRIKTEASLAGKLVRKGQKYKSLNDITDILGVRIITLYSDDVDKISALVGSMFQIDWANSIDKRKTHDLRSFGYMSLHYICSVPKELFSDEAFPGINEVRFEIQMCSTLQFVWANLEHDTGYKPGVEIPFEHLRNLTRLAGVLELVDDEFCRLRVAMTDYRRKVESLVANGKFDEVELNSDTFDRYLLIRPFDKLNQKIASINQAEIHEASLIPYLSVLRGLGFKTLGDLQRLIKENSEDAFKLAVSEIGNTDIDIISSTLALQDLIIVQIIKMGDGVNGLVRFFNKMNGDSPYNKVRAERIMERAMHLPFIQK